MKDYYLWQKQKAPDFSYRVFARQAGFSSPNFIKLVIDGKKNIGEESLEKLTKALTLKKREAEYFSYLVFFDQAKTTVNKNYYFGLIAGFKTRSDTARINADQYDYYSHWYNCVIREIAKGKSVDTDPAELAQEVQPAILPKQAKKSIKLLLELGLLTINASGNYVQSSSLVSTDRDIQSLAVRNFHSKMISLAREAIESVPREERDISSVTMKISDKGFNKIKKRIQEFREEIMQIIARDTGVDQVHQLNFQLFPVSKKGRRGK